jgi:hypothetical protein
MCGQAKEQFLLICASRFGPEGKAGGGSSRKVAQVDFHLWESLDS